MTLDWRNDNRSLIHLEISQFLIEKLNEGGVHTIGELIEWLRKPVTTRESIHGIGDERLQVINDALVDFMEHQMAGHIHKARKIQGVTLGPVKKTARGTPYVEISHNLAVECCGDAMTGLEITVNGSKYRIDGCSQYYVREPSKERYSRVYLIPLEEPMPYHNQKTTAADLESVRVEVVTNTIAGRKVIEPVMGQRDIANTLIRIREEKFPTSQELANIIGVHATVVSRIEATPDERWKLGDLARYAHAIGMRVVVRVEKA